MRGGDEEGVVELLEKAVAEVTRCRILSQSSSLLIDYADNA